MDITRKYRKLIASLMMLVGGIGFLIVLPNIFISLSQILEGKNPLVVLIISLVSLAIGMMLYIKKIRLFGRIW